MVGDEVDEGVGDEEEVGDEDEEVGEGIEVDRVGEIVSEG